MRGAKSIRAQVTAMRCSLGESSLCRSLYFPISWSLQCFPMTGPSVNFESSTTHTLAEMALLVLLDKDKPKKLVWWLVPLFGA